MWEGFGGSEFWRWVLGLGFVVGGFMRRDFEEWVLWEEVLGSGFCGRRFCRNGFCVRGCKLALWISCIGK